MPRPDTMGQPLKCIKNEVTLSKLFKLPLNGETHLILRNQKYQFCLYVPVMQENNSRALFVAHIIRLGGISVVTGSYTRYSTITTRHNYQTSTIYDAYITRALGADESCIS